MINRTLPFLILLCTFLSKTFSDNHVHINNHVYNPSSKHIQLHLIDSILNRSFFVGNIHNQWVVKHERHIIDTFKQSIDILNPHECVVFDVGMNDGFYTMMAAAYGCRVWSFEVQSTCIDIAMSCILVNRFQDQVMVYSHPVSNIFNKSIMIPYDINSKCNGQYRVLAPPKTCRICQHDNVNTTKTFNTLTLSHVVDKYRETIKSIDFLKIDTEGHEPQVLEGAEKLFKAKLVKVAVVEAIQVYWNDRSAERIQNTDIFKRILSYNYSIRCLKVFKARANAPVYNSSLLYETYHFNRTKSFLLALASGSCIDWILQLSMFSERVPGPPSGS